MSQKYLILGVPPGGLFLSRQLRKAWPDSVIYAIGDPHHDIGRFSNTINRFYDANTTEEIHDALSRAYHDMGEGEVKAFFCSNPLLECIVGQLPETFGFLEFENSIEAYQQFVNKAETDRLCRYLGIARPSEYGLSDDSYGELNYPVVVKPIEKGLAMGASKCAYIANEGQLKAYLEKLDGLDIDRKNLVCQQSVEGDNRWEYGYGGFFRNGKPLIDIYFHQFKQVPQGLCCYSREMTDLSLKRQIKDLVQPLLLETQYNGFMQFDVKQDSNTKMLYLLDVNPRPWRSADMLTVKLGDSTVFNPSETKKKVVWHYHYRELLASKNPKNVSYRVCRRLTGSKDFVSHETLYDPNDKEPLKQQKRLDWDDFIKRIKR